MSSQSDAPPLEIAADEGSMLPQRVVAREGEGTADRGWKTWYWLAIPSAAIAAYALVLRAGFLADDFLLIDHARLPGIDWRALLPGSAWFFYRPVGVFLTWELGWELWGYNPVPYHLVQLLLHAGTALVLGLWLASATGRQVLGWLAGLLFAVYPLQWEAVGWVAAQWDVMATLLGLLSLWCFTIWWRGGRSGAWLYVLSVVLYGLAVFTKESLLTFALVPGLVAWAVAPPAARGDWLRLVGSLLPFMAPAAINMGLRLVMLGELGTYSEARTDFGHFEWDYLNAYMRKLLAPINPAMMGEMAVQVTGLFSTALLLTGLVFFGRENRRLLALATGWVLLTILPVLNLPGAFAENLRDSRLLYLPSVGYVAGVAVLLYAAIRSARRLRPVLVGGTATLVGIWGVIAWMNVGALHQASQQAGGLVSETFRLIPVQQRPNGMVWYLENTPQTYKGAYMVYWGIGLARTFAPETDVHPQVQRVPDATQAPLAANKEDAYALRFTYDEREDRWRTDYAAGLTGESPPPSAREAGDGLRVWDFRSCSSETVRQWQPALADVSCDSGRGLIIRPTAADSQLILANPVVEPVPDETSFVRLRVALRYEGTAHTGSSSSSQQTPLFAEWFWHGPDAGFSAERWRSMQLAQDGEAHIYWTYIPAGEVGDVIAGLRFDPVSAPQQAELQWIALDFVE